MPEKQVTIQTETSHCNSKEILRPQKTLRKRSKDVTIRRSNTRAKAPVLHTTIRKETRNGGVESPKQAYHAASTRVLTAKSSISKPILQNLAGLKSAQGSSSHGGQDTTMSEIMVKQRQSPKGVMTFELSDDHAIRTVLGSKSPRQLQKQLGVVKESHSCESLLFSEIQAMERERLKK